ncbi:MAG TPA: SpoIVB peptidase S55 domain-containing protein [Actinomycetota bacterium]|nr:SpoIVB peptidase S55 domain-containing protein [Actinomycetota bacterium]
MTSTPVGGWTRRAVGASLAVLILGSLLASVPAAAVPVQQCPEQEIMPVADIRKGMTGEGLTVYSGTEPERFQAEILGVLENGIAPGRDMIIVEVSGDVIDRANGSWYGMSGSPVYVDNKLVGAFAWGLSFSTTNLGGLTAAEDMVKVLGYPEGGPEDDSEQEGTPPTYTRRRVKVPPRMQARLVRQTAATDRQVQGGFRQLLMPFSISGVSDRRLADLHQVFQREGMPLLPYRGASAQSGSTTQLDPATEPLSPGDSFAAALSYGDITAAGIGTTTVVCNGKALAFGHPFFFEGETFLGANHAEAITIVEDPVFGNYKLANVGPLVGVVDQDRLAAIRADLSEGPVLIPITSTVTATTTNQSRDGKTEAVETEVVPSLAFSHLVYNIDSIFDQYSGGSASLSWTIQGEGETTGPFTLTRSNLYADEFDVSFGSSFEMMGNLFSLLGNEFEEVRFTSVDVDATVKEDVELYRIHDVLVSLNGGDYLERRRLRARPGDLIGMQVVLTDFEETEERIVELAITLPDKLRRESVIEITGGGAGGPGEECFFFGENCESDEEVDSLSALISALENAPHNNDLLARLLRGGRRSKVRAQDVEVLEQVVSGMKRVRIRTPRGGGGGGKAVSEPKPEQ